MKKEKKIEITIRQLKEVFKRLVALELYDLAEDVKRIIKKLEVVDGGNKSKRD